MLSTLLDKSADETLAGRLTLTAVQTNIWTLPLTDLPPVLTLSTQSPRDDYADHFGTTLNDLRTISAGMDHHLDSIACGDVSAMDAFRCLDFLDRHGLSKQTGRQFGTLEPWIDHWQTELGDWQREQTAELTRHAEIRAEAEDRVLREQLEERSNARLNRKNRRKEEAARAFEFWAAL